MNDSPSPDTHVFIGMFRPRFEDTISMEQSSGRAGYGGTMMVNPLNPRVMVEIGGETHRDVWLRGHYDTPVYARREEILDRMARGAK